MNEPAVIVKRNLADIATVTCDVEPVLGMPLLNLKDDSRARVTRWMCDDGPVTIRGTFNGEELEVACAALDWVNFSAEAQITFTVYPNVDWTGTPTHTYGPAAPYAEVPWGDEDPEVDPWGNSDYGGYAGQKFWVHWFGTATGSAAVLGKSWQLVIDDPDNAERFFEASRLVVGDALVMTYNMILGAGSGYRDDTQQEPSDGGAIMTNARVPRRMLTFTFAAAIEAERNTLYNFLRDHGKRASFTATFLRGNATQLERDLTFVGAKFIDLPTIEWNNPENHTLTATIVDG